LVEGVADRDLVKRDRVRLFHNHLEGLDHVGVGAYNGDVLRGVFRRRDKDGAASGLEDLLDVGTLETNNKAVLLLLDHDRDRLGVVFLQVFG